MKDQPFTRKRMALYITLQTLTLVLCWSWFAVLWSIAFFNYAWDNFEWWLLVGTAFAGLYGLRPNLERAIDTAWLQGVSNSKLLAERVAQLKPVKRRIDLIFSVTVLLLLVLAAALWLTGYISGPRGAGVGTLDLGLWTIVR